MSASFDLDQKFTLTEGRVLLTGVQALVRLPMDQHRADAARGLRTATFISGYQGSPLGTLDLLIERHRSILEAHEVVWTPGVNEELAATAVWGTQEPLLGPLSRHDGVVGMWYGKGPGLDRCGDVFKHANFKGSAPNGGVLALAGDDPMAKSSTLPTQTEPSFYDAQMPILYPGTVQEILDLGLHGIALSRYSGLWVGFKVVTTMADGVGTAQVSPNRISPVDPNLVIDGVPWRHEQRPGLVTPMSLNQEREIAYGRLEAAKAYAAANGLNEIGGATGEGAWLGIVAAGRTFYEMRQALRDLGLSDEMLARGGIRLLRLGMVWPLEPGIVRRFADGLQEILVLDEKRAFIELFVRDILYGTRDAPRVVGKHDERGRPLVPAHGELTADRIAPILAGRILRPDDGGELSGASPRSDELASHHRLASTIASRLEVLDGLGSVGSPAVERTPYWCSGCPHNRSTAAPEGSIVGGGVGCHAMALWIDDRAHTVHQMGGEGATWIGRAPFTEVPHMFQNIGDGTFFHSGSLALRAAVAAGVNITYKILYNGAVAMTGGQDVAGVLGVPELTHWLKAEGAARVIVCSDDPHRYNSASVADGVSVWPRERLDEAQLLLRDTPGVTVLVYDQQCAAEKRRARKRGTLVTPNKRIFINEAVCEGCGDCGAKSHCLSVQPVQTELGRKTRIHQSSCNFDFTCIEGDCPAFIEVKTKPSPKPGSRRGSRRFGRTAKHHGRRGAVTTANAGSDAGARGHSSEGSQARDDTHADDGFDPAIRAESLTEPHRPDVGEAGFAVFMTGVGGTGVVTVSQVLATAGLLDGFEVLGLDQTGLSQKGGPVVSHLRFLEGDHSGASGSNLIGAGLVDCYLGFDLLVAADPRNLAKANPERTTAVVSVSRMPTGDMITKRDESYPDTQRQVAAVRAAGRDCLQLDATGLAETLLGSHMPANLVVLGSAYQLGAIPVSAEAIEHALTLNGVAVAANIAAFRWGRRYALNELNAEGRNLSTEAHGGTASTVGVTTSATRLAAAPVSRSVLDEASGRARRRAQSLVTAAANSGLELNDIVARRAADLVDYQSQRLAARYVDFVARTADTERTVMGQPGELSEAVAVGLYKLMAYKDEYEVARLHLRVRLTDEIATDIPNAAGYRILLHPPVLRAIGMKRKLRFGPANRLTLRALRAMRRVRGTPLDLFGHTSMRRLERRLVNEYRQIIETELQSLTSDTHARAVELARTPDLIRGYEEIKLAGVEDFRRRVRSILEPGVDEPDATEAGSRSRHRVTIGAKPAADASSSAGTAGATATHAKPTTGAQAS